MERAVFDTAKISAFASAWSIATYLVKLLIVAAIYIGLAESARLLPAMNPAATPCLATDRVCTRAGLAGRLPDLARDFSWVSFLLKSSEFVSDFSMIWRDANGRRPIAR